MFAINVRGPFFLMQEAIRLMIRDGIEGAIVNIGSMSEHAGQPFISAYCASKGALATLTRNTAFAVAANRIRVNQLDIGWMSSDHERELQAAESGDPDWETKAAAALPFGRLVDPAEVARAVNFLASDDAGLMTGAVVNFDQSVWGAYPGQAARAGRTDELQPDSASSRLRGHAASPALPTGHRRNARVLGVVLQPGGKRDGQRLGEAHRGGERAREGVLVLRHGEEHLRALGERRQRAVGDGDDRRRRARPPPRRR